MYNNPYVFNPQITVDRINGINNQIAELERQKAQMVQPVQQPTNLTQNFQISPNNGTMRFANSLEEVKKDFVIGDTPYFSKDMTVLWLKKATGETKTYELNEIVEKDEKDLKIEILQARIDELEKENKYEPSYEFVNEPIKDEESTNFQAIRRNKKK